MQPVSYDAFWSYAHADDDRQGGRLSQLAGALQDEFAVSTGDELQLFRDRASLQWGDLWRERVKQALGTAPFFIAIISPSFLRSVECRRELVEFMSEARSRGIEKLVLPILFVPVRDLHEDSDDEVIALIARTQWIDWTKIRLLDPADPVVRVSLNELAQHIQRLREEASANERAPIVASSEEENDLDLAGAVREIDARLESWTDAVEFDSVAGRQWNVAVQERYERVRRLRDGHASRSAVLSTFVRLGRDLLPIAVDRLEKAKAYSKATIEIHPYVLLALRIVTQHPEWGDLLNDLRAGVAQAVRNIEGAARITYNTIPGVEMTRELARADELLDGSMVYVNEANELVLEWRDRLDALTSPSATRGETELQERLDRIDLGDSQ